MKKTSLTLIAFFFVLFIQAQEFNKSFTVYFSTDSDLLSQESKSKLDSILLLSKNAGAYQIQLSAHTDQAGSMQYNDLLAKRREHSVADYLSNGGLISEKISALSQGERNPVIKLQDGEENQYNRRVEISLRYHLFRNGMDVLESQRNQEKQVFKLEKSGANEIEGKKGTTLFIPENAFMLESGEYVANNEVVFVLEEYHSMGDAILNGLATTTRDGELLESGGMLFTQAMAKGQNLKLREGMTIDVQMPSKNLKDGMTVFTGQKDENGIIVWEDTKTEFKKTNLNQKAKLPLPGIEAELLSWQVPITQTGFATIKGEMIDFKIPKRPNLPRIPKEPKRYEKPTAPEGERPLVIWFNAEWKAYDAQMKRYENDLAKYPTRYAYYERRLKKYHKQMKGFHADSAQYTQDVNEYNEKLNSMLSERQNLLNNVSEDIQKLAWNQALATVANRLADSTYYNVNLTKHIKSSAQYRTQMLLNSTASHVLSQIQLLERIQFHGVEAMSKYASKNGVFNMYKYQRAIAKGQLPTRYFYQYNTTTFTANEVCDSKLEEPEIAERLMAIEADIMKKKQALGIVDRTDVQNVYSTSISGMGYINCDRFSDVPAARMAKIELKGVNSNDHVMACVHSINSMLSFYTDKQGVRYANIPKGEKITLVAISAEGGMAKMEMKKYLVKDFNDIILLDPVPVKLEVMRYRLSKL